MLKLHCGHCEGYRELIMDKYVIQINRLLLVNLGMFGSVAPIGDIYLGREGWMLLLPLCRSPSSQISSLSPVWISSGCKGNAGLWYFTPHLNQWSLYLTMPGNYLGTLLDHVNSCRTRVEGGIEGREEGGVWGLWVSWRRNRNREKRKKKKNGGQKQNTQTQTNHLHVFICIVFCKYFKQVESWVRHVCVVLSESCVFLNILQQFFSSGTVPRCEGRTHEVRQWRLLLQCINKRGDTLKCKVIVSQMNSFCLLGPVIWLASSQCVWQREITHETFY